MQQGKVCFQGEAHFQCHTEGIGTDEWMDQQRWREEALATSFGKIEEAP